LANAAIRAYVSELSVSLSMHAVRAALFFKHEGYRHEQEYRFFQIFRADAPAPVVLVRGNPPVKYREFDWKAAAPTALREIVVGPAADFGHGSRFATECLRKANFAVEIAHYPLSGQTRDIGSLKSLLQFGPPGECAVPASLAPRKAPEKR
jgi:hypothetical protein